MKRIGNMLLAIEKIRRNAANWIAAALLLSFTVTAIEAQINCGGEGQRPCTPADDYYNIGYIGPSSGFIGGACDLALAVDLSGTACSGISYYNNPNTGGVRHLFDFRPSSTGIDPYKWLKFAMAEQHSGIQSDQAMNWISIFGTHNSYSNYQDGAFNYDTGFKTFNINVDQFYSIYDQLDLGARFLRLDPISYDGQLRLCHQSSDGSAIGASFECDLDSYGRLFAYGLAEVREWLDNNPGEILVIRMYRVQDRDKDDIDAKLREELGDLIWSPPTNTVVVPTELGRWPSLREMRSQNKRLIIFSNKGTGLTFPWSWVMNDGYTDAKPNFQNCQNVDGADVIHRDFNQWSYIAEDRSGSNIFSSTPGKGLLDATDVQDATNCGFGMVSVDFLMAGSYAASSCTALVGCSYDYRFGADFRREAAIWSWADGAFGDQGPAYVIGGTNVYGMPGYNANAGRWDSQAAGTNMRFACAIGQANEQNPANYNWVIPETSGAWSDGPQICQAAGGTFWAPQSPVENQNLIHAVAEQAPLESVWVNYEVGNIILEPLSPGLTGTDNEYSVNVTQGQSASALALKFQLAGGKGRHLKVEVATDTQLFKQVILSPYTKTITMASPVAGAVDSNGRIALSPGQYVTPFHLVEDNADGTSGDGTANDEYVLVVVNVAPAIQVTVDSYPQGQVIKVDNIAVTTPHVFSWAPGDKHSLSAARTVTLTNERLAFVDWSNGSIQSSMTYIVPSTNTGLTARFDIYYHLSLTTVGKGKVSLLPGSPDGYYLNGTAVTLTATPAANYYFSGFAGAISGTQSPNSVLMDKPLWIEAKFSRAR